jgi:hypothetical protein
MPVNTLAKCGVTEVFAGGRSGIAPRRPVKKKPRASRQRGFDSSNADYWTFISFSRLSALSTCFMFHSM